jgi:hypothetical protein
MAFIEEVISEKNKEFMSPRLPDQKHKILSDPNF